jgi:hypothetical protein
MRGTGVFHRIEIYFSDLKIRSYGWIKKGEDYEVLTHNSFRHRLNIYGAVDIDSLEVITRQSDPVNSLSICKLLRAIRAKNFFG